MNLSRVTLKRGDQECILQGMVHIAPKKLYAAIQGEMDRVAQKGYKVFFEGVRRDPTAGTLTVNQEKIKKFLLLIFEMYPVFARTLGLSQQKGSIVYPEGAINADISFDELVTRLDANGFRCNLLLRLFSLFSEEDTKEMAEERSPEDLFGPKPPKERIIAAVFKWIFFRKAMPIILDYRNEVAVGLTRNHPGNFFMPYGEGHMPGIISLLKKDGWTPTRVELIDPLVFC